MITERQEKILNTVIQEYINSARPISSKFLEKKYRFGICPASIRIEMQKLTEKGFVSQPHTSAGRIPTDKGYRFFVDQVLGEELLKDGFGFEIEAWVEEEMTNSIKFLQSSGSHFLQSITKNLALISSNLILGYLFNEKILWKEGWGELVKEPEFAEKKNINNFVEMIDAFEQEIDSLGLSTNEGLPVRVYIGKENPFPKSKEFSIIVSKCHFSDKEKGILAILGPKRMDYNRNINLINSLTKLLGN